MKDHEYEIANMRKLLGGVIVAPLHDDENDPDFVWWGFRVKVTKGGETKEFNVWVNSDAEGNGPGHLEIEDAL